MMISDRASQATSVVVIESLGSTFESVCVVAERSERKKRKRAEISFRCFSRPVNFSKRERKERTIRS